MSLGVGGTTTATTATEAKLSLYTFPYMQLKLIFNPLQQSKGNVQELHTFALNIVLVEN